MNDFELKEKYIIDKNRNLLPRGIFAWNTISKSLLSKLNGYGFFEHYLFSLSNEVNDKIQMNNYIQERTLYHISLSTYSSLIEEARTNAIDILQTYISLSKQHLAVNLLCGKKVSFKGEEKYIMGMYTKNKEFFITGDISLKQKENQYEVVSRYSSRIIELLSEINIDDRGLIFSPDSSLYQIGIVPLKMKENNVISYVRKLKQNLENEGYRVYLDESKTSEKDKMNKYLEMGIPLIFEIGPRDILLQQIEVLKRTEETILYVKEEKLLSYIHNFFRKVNSDLINNQVKNVISNTVNAMSIDELIVNLNEGNIVNYVWDGTKKTYDVLKNMLNDLIIYLPFNQELFMSKDILSNREGKYILTICKSI